MKKETVTDKLIKHFYGITGPLDEYKRREVDKIGNIAFIWLSWVLIIGNAIALILGYRYPNITAITYPIVLEVALFSLFIFVIWKGRKARISEFDQEELAEKEQKKLRFAGLKGGVFFGFSMYLWACFMDVWFEGENLVATLLDPHLIVTGLVSGLFFGFFMHIIIKFLQKHSGE